MSDKTYQEPIKPTENHLILIAPSW